MIFKDYVAARAWLEDFIPLVYGKEELGLARIENLLNKLGNPEKKFKSIHVGGTAGKGSTSFYISRLLASRGFKIGLHISPHLIYIGERMQINGKNIPVKRLVRLVNSIKPVVGDIAGAQPHLTPSYFEILVALSFLYFAEEKVDWAIVEVGLGGRLDATNVLRPKISVITNVGLDHMEILGDTIEKIAWEKGGIIKEKTPVVTAATVNALGVLKRVAKERKAMLINFNTLNKKGALKTDIKRSINKEYLSLRSMGEAFASQNKNLALVTVLSLGVTLDSAAVKKAFSVGFSGRFEQIDRGVILDGAHNEDKIKTLVEFINKNYFDKKITLVLAFKKGKNWQKMIGLLLKSLPINKVIATSYCATTDMGKRSAVTALEIKNYNDRVNAPVKQRNNETTCVGNSQEAVYRAISNMQKDEIVLVTGSLYLVGEARTLWKLPEF